MNIFEKLYENLFLNKYGTAVPGPLGDMLAQMSIHELGPHKRSGLPMHVAAGCKKKIVLIPGATAPAYTKEGKPVMAKDEYGRNYHVQDNLGMGAKEWKSRVQDEKRKAEGRWYSGKASA